MKERLKKLGRILGIGAIWVYVLSIPYKDKILFDYAHGLLVQNSLVDVLSREFNTAVRDLKGKAREALAEKEPEIKKPDVETTF